MTQTDDLLVKWIANECKKMYQKMRASRKKLAIAKQEEEKRSQSATGPATTLSPMDPDSKATDSNPGGESRDGSVTNSTSNDGLVDDSTANDGSVVNPTSNDGSVDDSTANDGSVDDSTSNDGSVDDSTANDGSVDDSTANDGSVEHEPETEGDPVWEVSSDKNEYVPEHPGNSQSSDLVSSLIVTGVVVGVFAISMAVCNYWINYQLTQIRGNKKQD